MADPLLESWGTALSIYLCLKENLPTVQWSILNFRRVQAWAIKISNKNLGISDKYDLFVQALCTQWMNHIQNEFKSNIFRLGNYLKQRLRSIGFSGYWGRSTLGWCILGEFHVTIETLSRQIPGFTHTMYMVTRVRPRASTEILHVGHEPSGSKVYFILAFVNHHGRYLMK